MKVVKDVKIEFSANKLYEIMLDDLFEVGIIAARRMEQDAKQFLAERIGEDLAGPGQSKSSGTLEDSITGFVRQEYGMVVAGVSASALEQGQWEESQGDDAGAAAVVSNPPFDYASVVEDGSGIYGPRQSPIKARGARGMRFGFGEETDDGKKIMYRANAVAGQKPKRFLADAMVTAYPGLIKLVQKVGTNLRVTDTIISR